MVDKNGNFLNVNHAYVKMNGYNRDELLHMSIKDVEALESQVKIDNHIQEIKQGELIKIRPDIPIILCTGFIEDADEE
jgi:PAS domain S-box-containing protein